MTEGVGEEDAEDAVKGPEPDGGDPRVEEGAAGAALLLRRDDDDKSVDTVDEMGISMRSECSAVRLRYCTHCAVPRRVPVSSDEVV